MQDPSLTLPNDGHIAYGRRLAGIVLVALLALVVDQVTKWLILNVVMQPPRTIPLAPFFNLVLGLNTGVSFGIFRETLGEQPMMVVLLTGAIVAALLISAWRAENRLERHGLSLVAGGALGNIFDRWRQGGVTDFLDFHWAGWHWPTFNMADVAIVLGVAAILLAGLRSPTIQAQAGGTA